MENSVLRAGGGDRVASMPVRVPCRRSRAVRTAATATLALLTWVSCAADRHGRGSRGSLGDVRAWAVQLEGYDDPTAWERLRDAPVDLVVIDALRSMRGSESAAMEDRVWRLQLSHGDSSKRKLCFAYLNIGQAEDYRSYWASSWRPPENGVPGTPDFLIAVDPDGWAGNYPVAYWDERWQRVLFGGPDALLDQVLADGFDGIYMDWVLGYQEPAVIDAAREAGVDPAAEMVELISAIRAYAGERRPGFMLIAQNGVQLAVEQPRFTTLIDGFSHEDLSFSGSSGAAWNDPASGDVAAAPSGPWSTAELSTSLSEILRRGVPVFTLDYSCRPRNVERAQQVSRELGFVPFVSRTPLDRLPRHIFEAHASPR